MNDQGALHFGARAQEVDQQHAYIGQQTRERTLTTLTTSSLNSQRFDAKATMPLCRFLEIEAAEVFGTVIAEHLRIIAEAVAVAVAAAVVVPPTTWVSVHPGHPS